MINEKKQPVMLVVLAHPDDESFGMGGTLALYAHKGVQTHLICATRGEVGEMAEDCLEGYASPAERRVAELRCAAGILGLSSVIFLDYRDSGMPGSPDNTHPQALAAAPLQEVAQRVAGHIRQLKPQVLVTFDPIGGYKHPDHIAIHNATVEAFHLAADENWQNDQPPHQVQKFYFHVMPKKILRAALFVMPLLGRDPRRFGKNGDINLEEIVRDGDFPTHAEIDCKEVRKEAEAASACHASQLGGGPPSRGPVRVLLNWMGRKDQFMRAYPPAGPKTREKDLFAGIVL
jgi:LmbE family N-acetylglucosaminyl deacetylase